MKTVIRYSVTASKDSSRNNSLNLARRSVETSQTLSDPVSASTAGRDVSAVVERSRPVSSTSSRRWPAKVETSRPEVLAEMLPVIPGTSLRFVVPRSDRLRSVRQRPGVYPLYFGPAGFQAVARSSSRARVRAAGLRRTVPALRLSASESPTLCRGGSHSQRQRVPLSAAETPTLSRREWDTQPLRLPLSVAESPTLCH